MGRTVIQIDESVEMACYYVNGQLLASIHYDEYKQVRNQIFFYLNGDFIGSMIHTFEKYSSVDIERVNAGPIREL